MTSPSFLLRAAAVGALVFLAAPVHAAISHSFEAFTETNYTGYLIRSDLNNANPLYNRDAIEVEAEMKYTRTGATDHHYEYRFDLQLIDSNGNPILLDLPGGATGTTRSVLQEVDMTGGPAEVTITTRARIRPVLAINPYLNYHVTVAIFRRPLPAGTFSNTGLADQTAPKIYRHFNSVFSGDAAFNVLSEVVSVQWNRLTRLQTDSDAVQDFFRVRANLRFDRYDKFGDPAPSGDDITTRLSVVMRDDLGNVIPLEQSVFDFVEANLMSYSTINPLIITPRSR